MGPDLLGAGRDLHPDALAIPIRCLQRIRDHTLLGVHGTSSCGEQVTFGQLAEFRNKGMAL